VREQFGAEGLRVCEYAVTIASRAKANRITYQKSDMTHVYPAEAKKAENAYGKALTEAQRRVGRFVEGGVPAAANGDYSRSRRLERKSI
jgi:hypothetical protein